MCAIINVYYFCFALVLPNLYRVVFRFNDENRDGWSVKSSNQVIEYSCRGVKRGEMKFLENFQISIQTKVSHNDITRLTGVFYSWDLL